MPNINEQLNQVEWAETQDSATKSPRQKPRWILPLVVTVVMIIVLIVVIFAVRSLTGSGPAANEAEQEMAAAEFDCQEARDVEKCLLNAAPRLAQQTGDAVYCKDLESDAFDTCVSSAAKTAVDSSLCRKIKDEARETSCLDAVLALSNDVNSPIEYCAEFSNEQTVLDCEKAWIKDKILSGECSHDVITEELCAVGAQYKIAIDAKDPDLCSSIVDADYRVECEIFVSPGDRDFDNLNATDEASYGTSDTDTDSDDDGLMDGEEVNNFQTDPANPDTDGDGFSDGEEIEAGFDPLS